MGTITDKINYLGKTKSELKDVINYGLPTSKKITATTTFREYVSSTYEAFIEALKNPDTLFDNLPKVTGSGEEITLNNTVETPLKLTLKGNTSQETTTGKNLYNVFDPLVFGDIASVDSDGWITISYNNTSGSSTKYCDFKTKATNLVQTGQTYKLVIEIKNVSGTGIFNFAIVQPIGQVNTGVQPNLSALSVGTRVYDITMKNDFTGCTSLLNSYCSFPAGQSGSITFRMSVIADTSVTPQTFKYEPFTGGIPAPNPDYPQEVQVVTGDNTIKVQNANLLNRETCLENKLLAWAMGVTSNETGSLASDFIKIEIGKTYQFTYKVQLLFYDKDKTYLGAMQDASGSLAKSAPVNYNPTSATIPNNNQICYMRLGYRTGNNSGVDLLNVNIMVNEGNTLLTYIPHQEQEYEINLGTLELCKKEDYQDYIYGSPNNWYKHKEIVKTRLLSTWNWFRDKELTNSWRFYSQSNVLPSCYNNNAMSNYFKGDTATNINTVDSQAITTINYTQIGLRINKSIAPTVEDLKTWLSNNEVYDYTILQTSVEEQITNAELIEQLNDLYYAYAYQEQTNINQSNSNLASIMEATAIKDLSGEF